MRRDSGRIVVDRSAPCKRSGAAPCTLDYDDGVTLNQRDVGTVTVIDVKGRIAVQEGAAAFSETLQGLARRGRQHVLVNLCDTPYIDSTALGEMIRAYTTLARKGGAFKLLNPTRHVRELLTLTNLSTVFEMFDSETDAVASFKPRTSE